MPAQVTMPLYLVVPCHLPISASVDTYRHLRDRCYLPLVAALEAQSEVRVSMHLGGHLLDMFARHDEHILLRLKTLCARGQIEILAGLFYGGPVALLPERDVRAQIAMSLEFWESFIGVTPQGIYLPQLAWAPELPRLLEDTGILYSFIGSNQRMPGPNAAGILGRIERGGQRLYTFTLDQELSRDFAPDQVPAFMARLARHHEAQLEDARPLLHGEQQPWGTGICLPGELFGAWGTQTPGASIGPLLSALADHGLYTTELPFSHFATPPKVVSVALGACYAPIVPTNFALDPLHDWSQFPGHFIEADTLYRRMLRASAKLRACIARMEDEGCEQAWSDTLATAQRQLFAAQSADAFGRATWPGFSDPAVRDAVFAKILSAESALDSLGQSADAAAGAHLEHKDLDGDRVPDIFISTPHLNVWLLPGRGGALRTLEHKGRAQQMTDVGIRREEAFRIQAILAPHAPAGDACAAAHTALLPRKGPSVQQDVDICERRGLRDWLLPAPTTQAELISGHVRSLADIRRPWQVMHAEGRAWPSDSSARGAGDGDHSHSIVLSCDAEMSCGGRLHIVKKVSVATTAAQVDLHYTLTPHNDDFPESGVRWAIEMPWRLGAAALALTVNDAAVPGTGHLPGQHPGPVRAYAVTDADANSDAAVQATLDGPVALWWAPRATLVRDPDGFREVPAGLVVVATTVVRKGEGPVEIGISLRF